MGRVSLQLEGGSREYEPGAQVIAIADWEFETPEESIELRLYWKTRGKGDMDTNVVQEVSFDKPEPRGQKRLGIQLPDSPYSFSGKLVSLIWTLELEAFPSEESDIVEFTLAPGGKEIMLTGASGSALGRAAAFLPLGDHRFVVVLFEIGPRDPREGHLVDRTLTVADPVARVGIALVRSGVVVPEDGVQHRARGQR